VTLNGEPLEFHRTVVVNPGDDLLVGSVEVGTRVYIAFSGGLEVDELLASTSTYLPAGLGGYKGRALLKDDVLRTRIALPIGKILETPAKHRPPITSRWALRACRSAETHLLLDRQRGALFDTNWVIGRRADRMGMQLDGPKLGVASDGRMPSAAVFPGTIQCPEDGSPFILGVDAGTTGGYPRIAQVARCDRHLLGQMRPGDHLHFLPRQPQEAIDELRAKHDYWRKWLPGIERII
jgi:allophanate hydrolase subunit 2